MASVAEVKSGTSKEAQIDEKLDALASKLVAKKGTDTDWVEFEELLARRGRLMRPLHFRIRKRAV